MHPSNLVMTMIGAGLLWVGWFGFNAGSSVSSGLSTAQALDRYQVGPGFDVDDPLKGGTRGKRPHLKVCQRNPGGPCRYYFCCGVVKPAGALA